MCEYCEKEKVILTFDESVDFEGYVNIINNQLVISNDYGLTAIRINYCPMCGRKLEEG